MSSIQEIVKKSIAECDKDIRGELLQNIITSGGSTNLINFGLRLQNELSEIHASESIKIEEKEHR